MKTLVISDTHLTYPFEQAKFNYLKKIISQADRVIINGDFWDGQLVKFKWFVKSPWKHLFPLLLERNTVYVYGNHDSPRRCDEQVKLFSTGQYLRYTMKVGDKTLIFEHGNRLCRFVDEDPWQVITPKGFLMRFIVLRIERPIIHTLGPLWVKKVNSRNNRIIKRKLKKELKEDEIYVCGHTHCAEFNLKERFINTGFMKFGIAQYLWIEDEKIFPVEGFYD